MDGFANIPAWLGVGTQPFLVELSPESYNLCRDCNTSVRILEVGVLVISSKDPRHRKFPGSFGKVAIHDATWLHATEVFAQIGNFSNILC